MDHDHLIGQVQHRARLTSRGGAEVAVRATLQTLEERISEGRPSKPQSSTTAGHWRLPRKLRHRSAATWRALQPRRVH
jgi:uncharacterized protein (DUF2267 family)